MQIAVVRGHGAVSIRMLPVGWTVAA
jgi:hypothetical protein